MEISSIQASQLHDNDNSTTGNNQDDQPYSLAQGSFQGVRDHPLEISGQAGKANSFGFLNQFNPPMGVLSVN
jgi:hypothetical protein